MPNNTKKYTVLGLFILSACSLHAIIPDASVLSPAPLDAEDFQRFTASSPLFPSNSDGLKSIQDLITQSKLSLYELANHEVLTNSYVFKADGSLDYMGAKLAASGQKILFQQDYVSYKKIEGKKVGILLRLEAEIIAKKADLNLNGIFAIGAAASTGSASGKLRLKVYGLSGKPIMDAIPAPSDVSEQSLLNAFTAIATIKSKIYEDDVFVQPQEIPEIPFELSSRR